jgi:hypothetical protein
MNACCRRGAAPPRRSARWPARAAALLPVALVTLLPKCPLCLAAWLTAASGLGISAAAAGRLRGALVFASVAVAAFALLRLARLRRSAPGGAARRGRALQFPEPPAAGGSTPAHASRFAAIWRTDPGSAVKDSLNCSTAMRPFP